MRKIALVLGLTLLATAMFAGTALACGTTVYDIQTDPINNPEGSLGVPCQLTVTATRSNGFYAQEAVDPGVNPGGEYSGIWIYTGADPGLVPGDTVDVCGVITEYFGLTELDVPAAGIYGFVLKTGTGAPLAPFPVTAAQVAADGEPWESVQVIIIDGMEVPVAFDLGNGEWKVVALDGTNLIFDDYWYDFANVIEGQCYNSATGIYNFSFNAFKLEPFVDGIPIVNCTVSSEAVTLGSIKAMYR